MAETERMKSREHWDGLFRRSHEAGTPMYGEGFRSGGEALIEHLSDRDVLDLGAGDGRLTLAMAANGNRVTSIDFSEEAIDHVRKLAEELDQGEVSAHVADLSDIERLRELLGDKTFDVVTFVNVLQFMDTEDVDNLFGLVAERLSPNGEMLIRAPQRKPPMFDTPEYAGKGALNQHELETSLQQAGLTLANYKEMAWPVKGNRTGEQPAYWAFAVHHPLSHRLRDNQVRVDGNF